MRWRRKRYSWRLFTRGVGGLAAAACLLGLVAVARVGPGQGDRRSTDDRSGVAGAVLDSQVFAAQAYGAICNGVLHPAPGGGTVDGNAIQAAIDAAERHPGGGTVLLPAGQCMISSRLVISHGPGITLTGTVSSADLPMTLLTNPENPAYSTANLATYHGGDLAITSDHNTVEDLVLYETAYGGAAYVAANYTTFTHMTVFGGPNFFALFFVGKHSGDAVGNRLLDSNVVSLINHFLLGGSMKCDDGIAWAFQDQSLIQNVTFTGTRLALYIDANTTVTGYTYYPGPQTCGLDGFYVTQPSSGISLSDLTMYGSGGVVSYPGTGPQMSGDVIIDDERLDPPRPGGGFTLNGPSHGLMISNAQQVAVEQSNLDSGVSSNSWMEFDPTSSSSSVEVESTTVPLVLFRAARAPRSTVLGTVGNISFLNDTFPARPPLRINDTFIDQNSGSVHLAIVGGITYNGTHLVYGPNIAYTVTDLTGY